MVLHKNRSREGLHAAREDAKGPIEKRHFNPEKGIRRAKLHECSKALTTLWGEPLFTDEEVEIFGRPQE